MERSQVKCAERPEFRSCSACLWTVTSLSAAVVHVPIELVISRTKAPYVTLFVEETGLRASLRRATATIWLKIDLDVGFTMNSMCIF
jgi:hypothetical protein